MERDRGGGGGVTRRLRRATGAMDFSTGRIGAAVRCVDVAGNRFGTAGGRVGSASDVAGEQVGGDVKLVDAVRSVVQEMESPRVLECRLEGPSKITTLGRKS